MLDTLPHCKGTQPYDQKRGQLKAAGGVRFTTQFVHFLDRETLTTVVKH